MGAITQLLLAAVAYSNLALWNHTNSVQLPDYRVHISCEGECGCSLHHSSQGGNQQN